ncbi:ATP synthase subunit I [Desulfuromonas carbonis]|uniref:ATP synthase subunit I n=1 Tax=Desulfuromonas sp. DDH964 TaxID=1823759 RepID=UPI00078D927F|nr:ATP synthase subunit I [Desulfuromonas sp. DDH964]AMV73775.1 hypothetical protein DBW_3477 [Desulfuromonas sp. DDH964]
MTTETLLLVLVLVAGIALGGLFFGGLWWTVQKGVSSDRPWLWFCVSLILRSGLVLIGFYLVAAGDWQRLLLSLLGFILARLIVTRLTGRGEKSPCLTKGAQHAPES